MAQNALRQWQDDGFYSFISSMQLSRLVNSALREQLLPILGHNGLNLAPIMSSVTSQQTLSSKPVHLKTRHSIPAVWMRAGTSKGLYLHRKDLPPDQADWSSILTSVMGSYDSDPRQLNGIGGATSTTSKVAVVSKSKRAGVDIDYTFVQCSVGSPILDLTGNCGNILSGVAPFAVDEGLVSVRPGSLQATVRIFNTNTNSTVVFTVSIDECSRFLEDGEYKIPGVLSPGSAVKMTFLEPAGSMTGALLPTKTPTNSVLVRHPISGSIFRVSISAVDAANPFIFIDGTTLPDVYHRQGPDSPESLALIETIRRRGAVLMGLAKDEKQAATTRGTPKVAVLSPSPSGDGRLKVTSFSMGKAHGSLQLTGAVCLATAACIKGTVAHAIRQISRSQISNKDAMPLRRSDSKSIDNGNASTESIAIRHPAGDMDVEVQMKSESEVEKATVFRTARRLFEGKVYYLM